MNFDDTARFFGPSEKLWPELFVALGRDTAGPFKCLMCGRPMRDTGKQWECRCGFFYKLLVRGSIPKKYRNDFKKIKRMCMTGRGENLDKETKCQTEVSGKAEYCPHCITKRRNASRRVINITLDRKFAHSR